MISYICTRSGDILIICQILSKYKDFPLTGKSKDLKKNTWFSVKLKTMNDFLSILRLKQDWKGFQSLSARKSDLTKGFKPILEMFQRG